MDTRLYFRANDGNSGYELWAHETTNESTWQVADIYSGTLSGWANDIVVMGTRLYFEAKANTSGYELWAHETTNGSTWQVADIFSGSGAGGGAPNDGYANKITIMGTRLYFEATDGNYGRQLWVHDTINGSTWHIYDTFDFGQGQSSGHNSLGNELYFVADTGGMGMEIHMMEIDHSISYD